MGPVCRYCHPKLEAEENWSAERCSGSPWRLAGNWESNSSLRKAVLSSVFLGVAFCNLTPGKYYVLDLGLPGKD